MRLVFAGTPAFAVPTLVSLEAAGHALVLVLTQPDRPAGRGLGLLSSPVKRYALDRGLTVAQPNSLKDPEAQALVRAAEADLMVVVAYGLLLPQAVLDATRMGAINVHASLLPRWRGAAPIQRAILSGDARTGITIMQMDAGLDTGAMLRRGELGIGQEETAGTLHDRLAALGATLAVETVAELAAGRAQPVPQPAEGVTYAHKIEKREALLDWTEPALFCERRVRAFNPSPGASARFGGIELKIWRAGAEPAMESAAPGTVIAARSDGIVVACGEGVLRLHELQRAGGKRLLADAFLRGVTVRPGERFTPADAD